MTDRADTSTARPAEGVDKPPVRTAVAMIVNRFPRVDETFILRELNELERHGQPVLVVPLLRGGGDVVHEEARPWMSRALYTHLVSAAVIRSNIATLLRKPLVYLRLLFSLIGRTIIRPSTCIRNVALFPKSVHLARLLPALGIRHVHAHFATHAATMAWIIASLSEITYSFTVHGPDVFVHRAMLREKIEKARFVRAISTFNKAFLSGLYPVVSAGKIHVVHSGVNPDVYEEAAQQSAKPHEKLRLLSIAGLTPSRGFPFLVDACASLIRSGIDIECTIVGEGPLRRSTEQWIDAHGLSEVIRVAGNLPQHEVARLMGEADVFVLPSIIAFDGQMDGIPISLMEAMAAGKPVVASAISGIPELVQNGVSGILVDSAYAERLSEAVGRLAADPELRARMGRQGRERVRAAFDVRRNAARLVELFDAQPRINTPDVEIEQKIASLNWDRLGAQALGVRRVHDGGDVFVAEVAISDGTTRRDVIVRQPVASEDEPSPLERARAEFETVSMLSQSMPADSADPRDGICYTLPRLMMFDEPNAAIVMERADGKSLAGIISETIDESTDGLKAALKKAGHWLRIFQQQTLASKDGRYVVTAAVVRAVGDLNLAAAADATIRRDRDAIIRRLRGLELQVADRVPPSFGHHGDFCAENIFIGERRVDVVSYHRYGEGHAAQDVAHLLVDLELRLRRELRHDLAQFREQLLDGYGTPPDPAALALFTLTSALEMLARSEAATDPRRRRILRNIIRRSIG